MELEIERDKERRGENTGCPYLERGERQDQFTDNGAGDVER